MHSSAPGAESSPDAAPSSRRVSQLRLFKADRLHRQCIRAYPRIRRHDPFTSVISQSAPTLSASTSAAVSRRHVPSVVVTPRLRRRSGSDRPSPVSSQQISGSTISASFASIRGITARLPCRQRIRSRLRASTCAPCMLISASAIILLDSLSPKLTTRSLVRGVNSRTAAIPRSRSSSASTWCNTC